VPGDVLPFTPVNQPSLMSMAVSGTAPFESRPMEYPATMGASKKAQTQNSAAQISDAGYKQQQSRGAMRGEDQPLAHGHRAVATTIPEGLANPMDVAEHPRLHKLLYFSSGVGANESTAAERQTPGLSPIQSGWKMSTQEIKASDQERSSPAYEIAHITTTWPWRRLHCFIVLALGKCQQKHQPETQAQGLRRNATSAWTSSGFYYRFKFRLTNDVYDHSRRLIVDLVAS